MSTTNSKSLRGRLGTAVRRTSSVLSLTRPTTPATPPVSTPKPSQTPTGRARSSSVATSNSETSSVGRPSVDTSPHAANPDSAPPTNSVPSPIAESPAREAAATAEEIRDGLQSNQPKAGPTPLAEVVTAPTETETPVETVESSQSGPREQTIIGSASGPHTFTEEPDEMSLRGSRTIESVESAPIPNPLPELSEAPKPEARAAPEIPAPAVTDAAPSYFEIPTHPPAEPVLDSSALKNAINENTMGTTTSDGQPTLDRQLSDQTTPRPHGPADTENASVFYAFSEMPVPAPAPPQATTEELPAPSYNIDAASTSEGVPASDPLPVPQNPRQVEEDPDVVQMPAPEVTGPVEPAPAPSVIQWVPQKTAEENAAISIPAPTFVPYDAGSSEEAWASQPAAQKNQETLGRQLADNSTQTLQDPFADPVPSIHISTIDTGPSSMPEPDTNAIQDQGSAADQQADVSEILLPVPVLPVPQQGALPSRSVPVFERTNQIPSHLETDETQPLLGPHRAAPTSYLQTSTSDPAAAHLNVSENPSSASSIAWPQMKPRSHTSTPRLHHLGWIEYSLPDTTTYYSHPTLRVITDVDLRSITKLDAVTAYLEDRRQHDAVGTPHGYELWLKEGTSADGKGMRKKKGLGKTKEFVPLRYWVDHKKRKVTSDPLGDGVGMRHQTKKTAEDTMDMEYRYWAFMEDHPAHIALPQNARKDAMDVLTWAWTDRLLPSQRSVSPPFTQAECQELSNLLRSSGESTGDGEIQAVLHTRIVSRILLRVAQWRQTHFRPHKPLPQDIGMRGITKRPSPTGLQRTFLDTIVSVIFLGFPYLFISRINSSPFHRLDEESGIFSQRSAGPMLLLGGCTCLVAAVVLSASITFLSLPGLDSSARVSGLITVLLATFSMVFSVVALFRYKSDLECVSSNVEPWAIYGGEGLMLHSKRIVILSLPLALLAYSIISFIVGIVLYSFFGVSEAPVNVLQKHFEEYTRWTVVGVLGGLTGILFTSMLLLRR